MGLRDAVFGELDQFFAPDRLSVAFTAGARQFPKLPVASWLLSDSSAMASLEWTAPSTVNVDGVTLYDGAAQVDHFAFLDEAGHPDYTRLLTGMVLEYSLIVSLTED